MGGVDMEDDESSDDEEDIPRRAAIDGL